MELIGRISKGSKMDQIYISKNRAGLDIGSYVIVTPINQIRQEHNETNKKASLFFYNVKKIEKLKVSIIDEIIRIIEENTNSKEIENILFVGSFISSGFNFKDLDIILISSNEIDIKKIEDKIYENFGIKAHIILIENKTLLNGLSQDPFYEMMLSSFISKNRTIYQIKRKLNYKLLDLHLLKSKTLIDNFDYLNGNEKYYLIRNLIALSLFIQGEKVSNENVDKEIKNQFTLKSIEEIKENMLDKNSFIKKYKAIYDKNFNKIMIGVKNASKQK
ncbi:MAG: hypothetical protein WC781_04300 [Candidatus Pacearchaeota archaeon]|jgi:hypothetical protein